MAIDKLKVMLSFMRELNDDNIPTPEDYGITEKEYYSIIEACQDEGLIKGALPAHTFSKKEYVIDSIRLTVKGMEYLNQNSAAMKTYKGLKEIREWLPF